MAGRGARHKTTVGLIISMLGVLGALAVGSPAEAKRPESRQAHCGESLEARNAAPRAKCKKAKHKRVKTRTVGKARAPRRSVAPEVSQPTVMIPAPAARSTEAPLPATGQTPASPSTEAPPPAGAQPPAPPATEPPPAQAPPAEATLTVVVVVRGGKEIPVGGQEEERADEAAPIRVQQLGSQGEVLSTTVTTEHQLRLAPGTYEVTAGQYVSSDTTRRFAPIAPPEKITLAAGQAASLTFIAYDE